MSQSHRLSAATVSNVTGELIDERLIIEAGLIDSDGGRPRVLLRVDPGYGHVVGVDVGETGVKVELFDLAMTALATAEHPLPSVRPDPATVAAQVASGLRDVLSEAGVDESSVIGVGIGVPGAVEQGSQDSDAVACTHRPSVGMPCCWASCCARATSHSHCSSTTEPRPWARPRCGSAPAGEPATR